NSIRLAAVDRAFGLIYLDSSHNCRHHVDCMRRASGRKTRGKALTSLAVSKQRVAQMKEAAAAARREAADASAEDPDRVPRRSRGRPTEPGSLRSIELRTGLSPRQQLRFKRPVAL